jgi:hypothetical protein
VLLNSDNIIANLFKLFKWQKMIYLLNNIIVFKGIGMLVIVLNSNLPFIIIHLELEKRGISKPN